MGYDHAPDSPIVHEFLTSLPADISLLGDATVKDVVLQIRRDIKSAVTCGALPPGIAVSVTRRDYNVVTVSITAWHGQPLAPAYVEYLMDCYAAEREATANGAPKPEHSSFRAVTTVTTRHGDRDSFLSDRVNAALWLLERIANRHNFDKSDIQTDYFHVGYYLHVDARTLHGAAEQWLRLEWDLPYADLYRKATEAANRLGSKVVESIVGKRGFAAAGEWAFARLIKMDEYAKGRPLAYSKRRRGWVVAQ